MGLMTYTSCCASIIPVEGAPSLAIGAVSVGDVEVAKEVDDNDFFDEALLLTKDDVEKEQEVEVDFDFEEDKGVF
jgi:hypothetical protein